MMERHPHGKVNTTSIYHEDLIDLDEPEISLSQAIEAPGYYAVIEYDHTYEVVPVTCFHVVSDGSLYGADAEGVDLAEQGGFQGYIYIKEGADALSSGRLEQLLKETNIEEV